MIVDVITGNILSRNQAMQYLIDVREDYIKKNLNGSLPGKKYWIP